MKASKKIKLADFKTPFAIAQAAGLSSDWNLHQRSRYTPPDILPQMELMMDRPNS